MRPKLFSSLFCGTLRPPECPQGSIRCLQGSPLFPHPQVKLLCEYLAFFGELPLSKLRAAGFWYVRYHVIDYFLTVRHCTSGHESTCHTTWHAKVIRVIHRHNMRLFGFL